MRRENVTILLVEDEEAHAEAIRRAFEATGRGVRLERALSLREASAYLEKQIPDLVIADWLLPDGKGTDILPSGENGHLFPFILMTSYGTEQIAVDAMKAGAADYVVKSPSAFAEIPRVADRVLRQWDLLIEHKRAQEALRDSEERYRAVVEDQTELICRISADWELEFANAAFDKFFGIEGDESIENGTTSLIPEEWRQVLKERCASLRPEEPVSEYDIQVSSHKGEARWLHWAIRGLFDEQGRLTRCQALGQDVTLQRRAEEALRQSELRFRTIFQQSQDSIVLKDGSMRYVDANPAFQELVGLPLNKIIGRTYEDLFGPEAAARILEVESRALRGETIEEENTRKINGVPMTFLDTRGPLKDESGNIIGILVISRDITDRKRVETGLPQAANEGAEEEAQCQSAAMRSTLNRAILAANRNSIVLLTGESGSGKDHLARLIHNNSDRAAGPYFMINCAAIAPELAESELFGHEKGAFTGAPARKRGLLELAEGGSLLMNEIGELSLPLQAKLLTFLDTRKFTRVGGEKQISVDARLIIATNRDLQEEVEAGRFRPDLFYRINVIAIPVPALRERTEDIPGLVRAILSQLRTELRIEDRPVIGPGVMKALKNHSWPGNVRELRNVLERALIVSSGRSVDLGGIQLQCLVNSVPAGESCTLSLPLGATLQQATDSIARVLCIAALDRSGGNKRTAARDLGISRDTLYRYLQKFGIGEGD